MSGKLVLVGTPIGNLEDLSPRAVATLRDADLIACEDTRRTGLLLQHAGITRKPIKADDSDGTEPVDAGSVEGADDSHLPDRAPLLAVHDHNETQRINRILDRLRKGALVALVSDAGMPGISDPGEELVHAVAEAGIAIEVVPGPSAGISALVMSGLPVGRHCFEGFLPRKGSARRERLGELVGERRTMVFYEAPHRIERTLTDLAETLGGDRGVSLSREITKRFEETWRGTLEGAGEWAAERDPRGEFVVVVAGAAPEGPADDDVVADRLRREINRGASTRDAVAAVAADLALPKRRVYSIALEL